MKMDCKRGLPQVNLTLSESEAQSFSELFHFAKSNHISVEGLLTLIMDRKTHSEWYSQHNDSFYADINYLDMSDPRREIFEVRCYSRDSEAPSFTDAYFDYEEEAIQHADAIASDFAYVKVIGRTLNVKGIRLDRWVHSRDRMVYETKV